MMTISWVAAALTVLAAFVPVTREQLTWFAATTGVTLTPANAALVVEHFVGLRRWRLISLAVAAPLTGFTDDLFYLVLGWCAPSVLRGLPFSVGERHGRRELIYRTAWRLALGAALASTGFTLVDQGVDGELLAHAAAVVIAATAVSGLAAKRNSWTARGCYLSGTAIVLCGALLVPIKAAPAELPEYTMPRPLYVGMAMFGEIERIAPPTCAWRYYADEPCRSWQVNGEPFPQAATYLIGKGGAPRAAPLRVSPDGKAVVYLDGRDRRMVRQDRDGIRPLTGRLADADVPTPTFAGQNRYVALSGDGAQIIDTKTWDTLRLPDVRQVHDLNASGIVASTGTDVIVFDAAGKRRMSLTQRKIKDAPDDTYHLRADGRRFVVIRGHEMRVETYDPRTGARLSAVTPAFPGDDFLDVGLGWTKQGDFLVRGYDTERTYHLDLTTGRLWRPGK
ncbi:hypothetical protein HII36_35590 [Nonomuraea sp. NN258]|uniref:hypothetical protein n=1 Tax=Nonomuraea antri TaxID=2730852 RepID=UPI0015682733|nr:hypothetical protein [Nonomuraea antri]NRQ37120.1 hypothetical protein [Nonomuraea antri]